MAESSSSVMATHRSISLPTRLIHPKAQRVEEKVIKIQSLSSSSLVSSSSPIKLGLTHLIELYDFVNEQVICSPQGQQALRPCHKLVEEALDDSIMLLDVCHFTRDLIGTFLEQIQDLQSTLRRRGGDLSTIQYEIQTYFSYQKNFKNIASRQLKSLARTQTKKKTHVLKRYGDSFMVSNILRQSNSSTISIFESLLKFLASSSENKEKNGTIGCVDNSMIRSFYGRIIGKRIMKVIDVQTMLGRLGLLHVSLETLKDELSYLSRRLIQHRVSLLNIVTS